MHNIKRVDATAVTGKSFFMGYFRMSLVLIMLLWSVLDAQAKGQGQLTVLTSNEITSTRFGHICFSMWRQSGYGFQDMNTPVF